MLQDTLPLFSFEASASTFNNLDSHGSSQFFLTLIFVSFTILFHLPHYFDYSNRHIHQSVEEIPRFSFKKVLAPEDINTSLRKLLKTWVNL